jgi:hypothetical protein
LIASVEKSVSGGVPRWRAAIMSPHAVVAEQYGTDVQKADERAPQPARNRRDLTVQRTTNGR